MFVFKEGDLTTLDQSPTIMMPGTGAVLTSGWSEAGSLVPRGRKRTVPRSPCHPNMSGSHSTRTRVWGGDERGEDPASAPTLSFFRGPPEPRKASWRWRAGKNQISQRRSNFLGEWKSLVFSSFFFCFVLFRFIIPPRLGPESPGPEAAVGGFYGLGGWGGEGYDLWG